jgi:hypothetical protein
MPTVSVWWALEAGHVTIPSQGSRALRLSHCSASRANLSRAISCSRSSTSSRCDDSRSAAARRRTARSSDQLLPRGVPRCHIRHLSCTATHRDSLVYTYAKLSTTAPNESTAGNAHRRLQPGPWPAPTPPAPPAPGAPGGLATPPAGAPPPSRCAARPAAPPPSHAAVRVPPARSAAPPPAPLPASRRQRGWCTCWWWASR